MKVLFGIIVTVLSLCASAQQPVKVLHQFAPSATFAIALNRFAEPLSAELKRPVVFEGYSGAGGAVMMNAYQNLGDNNTFLVAGTNPYTVIPLLQKVDYRTDDLEPLALFALSPMCYAARNDAKETEYKKFIAANKGKFYGSLGISTIEALLLENINRTESLGQTGINYKSYAEITTSLMRGDIQWTIVPKNLCGGNDIRSPQSGLGLVEIKGVPANLDPSYWFGIFGKKSVDRKILDSFTSVFVDTWWKNKEAYSKTVHYPEKPLLNEEFKKYIEVDRKKWEAVIKK